MLKATEIIVAKHKTVGAFGNFITKVPCMYVPKKDANVLQATIQMLVPREVVYPVSPCSYLYTPIE